MKKYILFAMIISVIPNYVFGESERYRQLVEQKQQKMSELAECTGGVDGWKIAGISTLGLTAVGIAGNIILANKQSDYDKKIASTDNQIKAKQQTPKTSDKNPDKKNHTITPVVNTEPTKSVVETDKKSATVSVSTGHNITEQNKDKTENSEQQTELPPKTEKNKCIIANQTFEDGKKIEIDCDLLDDDSDFSDADVCECTCNNGTSNCKIKKCDDSFFLVKNRCLYLYAKAEQARALDAGHCWVYKTDINDVISESDDKCFGLNQGEWEAEFSYGTIKGESVCAKNAAKTYGAQGTPNDSGQYCWCKAVSFAGDEDSVFPWVYFGNHNNEADCLSRCAGYVCTYHAAQGSAPRLYGKK